MIRYNTKEDKLEMSYEDICMTLHDCSDTLDCSTGYGGTYEAIVDYIDKLQNNWNELKKGLQSLFEFDEGVVSKDYLECAEDTLMKMEEMEQGKEWKE